MKANGNVLVNVVGDVFGWSQFLEFVWSILLENFLWGLFVAFIFSKISLEAGFILFCGYFYQRLSYIDQNEILGMQIKKKSELDDSVRSLRLIPNMRALHTLNVTSQVVFNNNLSFRDEPYENFVIKTRRRISQAIFDVSWAISYFVFASRVIWQGNGKFPVLNFMAGVVCAITLSFMVAEFCFKARRGFLVFKYLHLANLSFPEKIFEESSFWKKYYSFIVAVGMVVLLMAHLVLLFCGP